MPPLQWPAWRMDSPRESTLWFLRSFSVCRLWPPVGGATTNGARNVSFVRRAVEFSLDESSRHARVIIEEPAESRSTANPRGAFVLGRTINERVVESLMMSAAGKVVWTQETEPIGLWAYAEPEPQAA